MDWRILRAGLAAGLLGLAACAPGQVYVSDRLGPLGRVAVLPLDNESTDLDGPPFVRRLIREGLIARGCDVVPLEEVDQILKDNGFTDGGQLGAATPQDLGKWLGASHLFYGVLVDFNMINVGFYWQRKVTVAGTLVEAASGEKLWNAQRTWMTLNVVTDKDKAGKEFVEQLAVRAVEKMAKMPLPLESQIAVTRLLETLPQR